MDAAARRHGSNVYVLDPLASALDSLTAQARESLQQQARAIAELSLRLDQSFADVLRLLYAAEGHVVITGLGKSGHVGRKIAATLASTGTPSFFVHSGEALHGDLGMITNNDVVLMISRSGETSEVVQLLPFLARRNIRTIALVGDLDSTLARGATLALDAAVDREICPNNLAPTSSTLATLAMGDALAVALMKLRGFQKEDFAKLHPNGSLGRQLSRVADALVREGVPVLTRDTTVHECLFALAKSELPLALVCEGSTLLGVVTSDDLRRAGLASMEVAVEQLMDVAPPVVAPDTFISDAEMRMQQDGLDALVVVDSAGELHGVFAGRR
ncbi:MAG TPA: KpsF/GutQ family sugar-phosphate isomerase [Polyangiaceae bacterium]|nr:KpsF/GutQ family sugar-phosphate isomerase [Polyangiaceae bacterium]